MARVNLFVPYAEKDAAKSLGAKWDAVAKTWYVPDGIESASFQKWLSAPRTPASTDTTSQKPEIRCNRFFVATAHEKCWKCSAPVQMVAIVLPRGWEQWQVAENDDEEDRWVIQEMDTLLNYVGYLNEAAITAAQGISSGYKLGLQPSHKTQTYKRQTYLNHCLKCGTIQAEPNSGNSHVFKPETPAIAEKITLHYHQKPFEGQSNFQDMLICHGGYNAFDFMKRA